MEKITEAILSKVKMEAQNIIEEAEGKARQEIVKAKEQREIKLEEEKRKVLEEAEEEAARIVAQASIKTRQDISRMKADIIDKIIDRVKQNLSGVSSDESYSLKLIKEAMGGLSRAKGRIYVPPKDVSTIQKLLEKDKELASRIIEVKAFDCTGGVIAEDVEAKLRIDNTYEARLEMLMPEILPEISKMLFSTL